LYIKILDLEVCCARESGLSVWEIDAAEWVKVGKKQSSKFRVQALACRLGFQDRKLKLEL